MERKFIQVKGIWKNEKEFGIDLIIPIENIFELFWLEGELKGKLCYKMCDGSEEEIYLDREEFKRIKSILLEEPKYIDDWAERLCNTVNMDSRYEYENMGG